MQCIRLQHWLTHHSLKPAKDGTEDIIMIERYEHIGKDGICPLCTNEEFRYKDMKALQAHGSSEKFTTFQKQMEKEDLIRAPMLLKMVAEHGGFSSRL